MPAKPFQIYSLYYGYSHAHGHVCKFNLIKLDLIGQIHFLCANINVSNNAEVSSECSIIHV